MAKISPRDYLKCFKRAREQGIQGEALIDAISACVREVSEKGEREKSGKENQNRQEG